MRGACMFIGIVKIGSSCCSICSFSVLRSSTFWVMNALVHPLRERAEQGKDDLGRLGEVVVRRRVEEQG